MNQLTKFIGPLDDELFVQRMTGSEGLSRLFEYNIDLLSTAKSIDPYKLLGKVVTVELITGAGGTRHFSGYVTRFSAGLRQGQYMSYQAVIRPWFWFLTRTQDCRVYQDKTVIDIVRAVFADHAIADFEDHTTASFSKWSYCVQYRETDFAFVSRMLEDEGVYYYFKHKEGRQILVLADPNSAVEAFEGYAEIPYREQVDSVRDDAESILSWDRQTQVQSGKYVITDYDFERPAADLAQRSSSAHVHDLGDAEVFEYPGYFIDPTDGEQYVRVRQEELDAQHKLVAGQSDARGLCCGASFTLQGFPISAENAKYLLTQTQLTIIEPQPEAEGAVRKPGSFSARFTAINAKTPFRPPRVTPKPTVSGPQPAVVVGAGEEEVHTDKYGRVRVQFLWDRQGKRDKGSSCWLRVSQPWAGKNSGFVALPRVGDEVIVSFYEGDPDNPVVTGRVYNANRMPPWNPAENKYRTGIMTRSEKAGGEVAKSNELHFEDADGKEKIYVHAEKDLTVEVENNELREVGNDRKTHIKNDETLDVDGKRTVTIKKDESLTVTEGNRTLEVSAGTNTETIQGKESRTLNSGREDKITGGETRTIVGDLSETITGNVSQTMTGNYTQTATGSASHTAVGGFSFTTPANYAVTAAAAVLITTPSITLAGGATLTAVTPQESNVKGAEATATGAKAEAVGVSVGATGVNTEVKGVDISVTTLKGETTVLKTISETLSNKMGVLSTDKTAVELKDGAIALAKKALSIFS
jgi:type VI secretion system secreted protein VgrG